MTTLRTAAVLGLNALHECIVPKGAETQISDAMRALRSAIDADLSTTQPEGFQARYRIPGGEWSSWGHVVCGVKGHEQELRIAPGAAILAARAARPEGAASAVADTLERFNAWRCDSDGVIEYPETRAIGEALDKAVAMLRAVAAPTAGDARTTQQGDER